MIQRFHAAVVARKRAGGGASTIDPLADLPFLYRFQTIALEVDSGTGTPDYTPANLYTDAACTTLATSADDAIAGVKIGGTIIATQSTSGSRPLLKIGGDGVPCIACDGTDDELVSAANIAGDLRYAVAVIRKTGTMTLAAVATMPGEDRDLIMRLYPDGIFDWAESGNETLGALEYATSNGEYSQTFSSDAFQVVIHKSKVAHAIDGPVNLAGKAGAFNFLNAKIVAFFLLEDLTNNQVNLLRAYCANLCKVADTGNPTDDLYTTATGTDSGSAYSIYQPIVAAYRTRSVMAIMFCHGSGENSLWATNGIYYADNWARAMLDAGYTIFESTLSGDNWGNEDAVADLVSGIAVIKALDSNITKLQIAGHSMGGLVSQNALARHEASLVSAGVKGWVGMSACCSLSALYNGPFFQDAIKAAFGIASDGSDYSAKTSGYDPLLQTAANFSSFRMLFLGAENDTLVPWTDHSVAQQARVDGVAVEATIVSTPSGGHAAFNIYDPDNHLPFAAECAAD